MNLKIISIVVSSMLWLLSFVFGVLWFKGIKLNFEIEPLTYLLGLISLAVSSLAYFFINAINKEKYSTANALAQGYVNNFVEPTLTKLIKVSGEEASKPIWYIYIPEIITELTPQNIDRLKVKLRDKGLIDKTVKVKLDEGRGVRDVMNLSKADNNNVYFDFPNTILTLLGLIEYKVDSPKNSLCMEKKNELGSQYIEAFKSTLIESLTQKGLYPEYIKLTDKSLAL